MEEAVKELLNLERGSETLGVVALVVAMSVFAGGILYEGTLLQGPQRTAQLVVPDPNP